MQDKQGETAASIDRQRGRLPELDGFRALAVLAVVLFHFFQRFGSVYPYGDTLLPFARYGWLGVDLFFIISGFVIALTLERTATPFDFVVRRGARLVPAMLVCSVLIFMGLRIIDTPFARAQRVGIEGFVPSLTFTDPWLWQKLIPGVAYIDGAFWSLFVEVRFYFWAAVAYFLLGPARFLPVFLATSLAILGAYALMADNSFKVAALLLFFPDYLPLFCAGMLAHALFGGQRSAIMIAAFALFSLLSILLVRADGPVPMLLVALFILMFVLLVVHRKSLQLFALPQLGLVGACSYSLYLIHQNLGVALISLLPRGQSLVFYGFAVLGIFSLLLGIAVLVYRTVELPAQSLARRWLKNLSASRAPATTFRRA